MDAIIYTKDGQEYEMLSRILMDESPGSVVKRGLLDGHYHLKERYDIVVVSVDGALGMELMCNYRERFDDTLIIWITNDPYFAGLAIRKHIFDFIVRPVTEPRFREAVKDLGKNEQYNITAVQNKQNKTAFSFRELFIHTQKNRRQL